MPEAASQSATLGLGGNIGDPVKAMAAALRRLNGRDDCRVTAVSRLYRTPPWGKTDQSFFFNACAAVETRLEPEALLDVCLSIEREMKRERIERWGPRTLDIDVLTYGDVIQDAPRLELPHPRMTDRGFVLMPLADIAPGLRVRGRAVSDWLSDAEVTGIEVADDSRDWWLSA
ncbi:2-amino-4-hydroxy-6-hydroxymethyldihydropteridine diphosphokinase [Rhizobium laguerreae]|uniref:2-amino-4-hydroxy-6-hydroxymethyldihydropteridine pyrophosphokinase n=1 Tax=Rhizobium laguerreae TaxID=1076926 RepID=A0AB35F882_9HYPH|nr:2-amino-4-hydroxy-6-hydroxymethyldihydropteridine diphosphokinase [Rhizobium laguerreae]MBY3062879.1 2-amino-4-hydroxy-6-hydroxymethyldihydropteridine diphosphokinase [Rhizobium laguerreae]MBY3076323.1 2-amino-4-hydroxy-6-hydroxymethyldihydropteridine diphosphokinase [Rhizobium laguerreae]MBY3111353.1 2-amino-4-hydroxy-6-hydroxymethyldihydropteridine diphosphokinase [Rhizobium laguerreae]MBY3241748.1 2-amino-4-hydroxy-6-hydroxymethyldihydropteridine diphosphokinase [Rhizobium laguerreae]MBY